MYTSMRLSCTAVGKSTTAIANGLANATAPPFRSLATAGGRRANQEEEKEKKEEEVLWVQGEGRKKEKEGKYEVRPG